MQESPVFLPMAISVTIKQEYAAALFCRNIGEAPKVSESDRRACRRQNETDAPGEAASFFVHFKRSLISLDFLVESTLIY